MESTELKAIGVRWNLGDLYSGVEDPRIEADIAGATHEAKAFDEKYRGQLVRLDGARVAQALAEYEALSESLSRPSFYAGLLFSEDTQNAKAQQLVQRTREAATETSNLLVFFALELIALEDAHVASLLSAPEMSPYAHYLTVL